MTWAEVQICEAMVKLLQQPKYRGRHISDKKIISKMLERRDHDLLAFHSQWLFDLAWAKRHVLPGNIAVMVALKRWK